MSDLVDKALHAYDDAEIVTCGGVPCEATEITSPRTRMGAAIATVLRDMKLYCVQLAHSNEPDRTCFCKRVDAYASENGIDLDQGEE